MMVPSGCEWRDEDGNVMTEDNIEAGVIFEQDVIKAAEDRNYNLICRNVMDRLRQDIMAIFARSAALWRGGGWRGPDWESATRPAPALEADPSGFPLRGRV